MTTKSMVNFDDEFNSDGLEILSIGALYTGAWDKKYWSSSRGKDRYPYPVGYQALRTHKGITYKMEIHEGSKGPKFQITSNDKQCGSGETPDRACDNFQKKCCSRIKLWHGKRSSGKIDGVEFFGFKNALVQRLLRELVATVNDASDQSSVLANFDEASSKGLDVPSFMTHECPDLRSYLDKTTVTGKRSRTCRGADANSACKSGYKRCQPPHQVDHNPHCSVPGKTDVNKPLVSCALSDCPDEGALQVLSNKDPEAIVSSSTEGLPMSCGAPADPKADPCLIQVQSELPGIETRASVSSLGIDMPQDVKPEEILSVSQSDRQCTEIQEGGFPVITKEGNEKVQVLPELLEPGCPVQMDCGVNHYDDLCAPDTLDALQGISSAPNLDSHGGETAIARNEPVHDLVYSEDRECARISSAPNFDSHGGEAAIARNETVADLVYSEDSEFDSVEDIAKSMMAVLLPRAIPLLKYSSRKRRKTKPPEESSCAPKLENNPKIPNEATPSADVKSSAGNIACSALDGQVKEHPSSVLIDSGPLRENIRYYVSDSLNEDQHEDYVVPDSLDKDQYENYVANEPPPSYANAEVVAANLQMEMHKPDREGLSPGPNATESSAYQNETAGIKEIFSHEEPQKTCGRMIQDTCVSPSSYQVSAFGDGSSSKASLIGGRFEEQIYNLQKDNVEDALAQRCDLQDQAMSSTSNNDDVPFVDGCDSSSRDYKTYIAEDKSQHPDSVFQSSDQGRGSFLNCASHIKEDEANTNSICLDKRELNDEIEGAMKLIGCYSHPMRISAVKLTRYSGEIYICVSCGLEERKRDLFLYKLSIKEPCLGSPCMVGHTSMCLPSRKDEFGREVAVDKSGLQFSPDARSLVLVDSIRMPYCREKNLHCLCPQCESCCFAENAVKIVQIQLGYATLVLKLNTVFPVQCVLVCKPEHLIAVDESGRIYIWVMNSTWSIQTEVYVIPSYNFIPSRVVELKRIPKSASLVVGHNGYGEFSLWDIIKRTVVSRFSAPSSSILDFLPVSLLSWPSKALSHDKADMEGCVRKLEEATMLWLSRDSEANISGIMEGEDFAVWLLICTSPDPGVQSACYSSNYHLNSDGCWRIGLLVKDVVIFGAALQSSTTAVGSTSGTGIIGTREGQVYVWDLTTGSRVETLHDLEGNGVLHIATDDSSSSAVAIAGEGGQLCVYLHS